MHEVTFRWILTRTKRTEEVSVSFILAWMMLIDSNASDPEVTLLREVHRDPSVTVDQLIEAVHQRSPYDVATALRILDSSLSSDNKKRFIELVILMMVADNAIHIGEQHVLRLVADTFTLLPIQLNRLYRGVTGRILPELGDPSSPLWWKAREQANAERAQRQRRVHKQVHMPEWALSTLGLSGAATQKEIRTAFREMSSKYHPDRFHALGEEAVAAGHVIFRRIKAAYDELIRHA